VPFSLNRGLEPYLLLSRDPLLALSELRARPLCFAPLVDSLSSLAFRDPADYRLGEGAFQHRPVLSARRESVSLRGAESSSSLLTNSSLRQCPVEGGLVRSQLAAFSLTPCHELADRYARVQGVSGHGPSGVMNQSVLATPQGLLSTWRYERNFDSWSGRSADVARHPSLNFLGWERPDSSRSDGRIELRVVPLVYSGYPSECKIEDLRLFAVDGTIYAIAALILSRSRAPVLVATIDPGQPAETAYAALFKPTHARLRFVALIEPGPDGHGREASERIFELLKRETGWPVNDAPAGTVDQAAVERNLRAFASRNA
jgi:hypothetical protein